jgi:hypothetical protein
MSVSVLVTVLGSTVTVLGAAGAAPPDEPCFSWLPALPVFADAELVVVVVVVVVVGAVLPLELHATDSNGHDADGEWCPFADLRDGQRQRNLAFIAKVTT